MADTITPPSASCKIIREELVAACNWVRLKKIHWEDPSGRQRVWESAERTTRRGEIDAVEIFPVIRSEGKPPSCLLVRQFRPPVQKETIEFPAGLIDAGETPGEAALRELKEETGYSGAIRSISPVVLSDAGMTNANMVTVIIDVDGDLPENMHPIPAPDDGEFIHVYQVPIHELYATLLRLDTEGCAVDSRVWNFAEGMKIQQQ